LLQHANLVAILREESRPPDFQPVPTGVEVCPSNAARRSLSRDQRIRAPRLWHVCHQTFRPPVSYQNFPDAALPVELKNANSRNIWRIVDGKLTKENG